MHVLGKMILAWANGALMIPLCEFKHMRRDANANVDNEMDACNSCKMHPRM